MTRTICVILVGGLSIAALSSVLEARQSQPAASAFERFKALDGEWIDVDGVFGTKGAVGVIYKVTSGGTAVIERFPLGSAEEMLTMYHQDGTDLVLTHYCSAGNQPRMRARTITANVLAFEYDGGTNVDPATTSHMHSVRFEFLSKDEIKAVWQNWSKGRLDHAATFRLVRKKG